MARETGTLSLLFRVSTRLCALPLEHVVETMRPQPVERFAGAPAFVMGVAVIRGDAVPVVDVAAVLAAADSAVSRFVTVRAGARRVALAVGAVVGIVSVPAGSPQAPPLLGEARAEAIAALGTLDGELLCVLDSARMVPDSLWDALEAGGVRR
ncbi:MAG: hypothetical protein A3H97_13085 [Acidobacteria bacterium RIFCSPLOWO2_02_FULL_65_29]|nr:MAG: hypothetical protein A3H97_13085 [Acidobacteria bacterium RIFCSPLOWO2_02_FULL_65_29]